MSKHVGLYLLNLSFNPAEEIVGSGKMTLALTVNTSTGELHGQALGTILEGTQHPSTFSAKVSGAMHSTGFGPTVKIGSISGEAGVVSDSGKADGSRTPPEIGCYLAKFIASFSLDSNWNGQGQFSIGSHTYKSEVGPTD